MCEADAPMMASRTFLERILKNSALIAMTIQVNNPNLEPANAEEADKNIARERSRTFAFFFSTAIEASANAHMLPIVNKTR